MSYSSSSEDLFFRRIIGLQQSKKHAISVLQLLGDGQGGPDQLAIILPARGYLLHICMLVRIHWTCHDIQSLNGLLPAHYTAARLMLQSNTNPLCLCRMSGINAVQLAFKAKPAFAGLTRTCCTCCGQHDLTKELLMYLRYYMQRVCHVFGHWHQMESHPATPLA